MLATARPPLEILVGKLREMETADPFNNQLRSWAEVLVEAFDAIAAAYDDIHERMAASGGGCPRPTPTSTSTPTRLS